MLELVHESKSLGYGALNKFNEMFITFKNSNANGSSGSLIYSLNTESND